MIILITDGVPDDFDDLFEQYNPEVSVISTPSFIHSSCSIIFQIAVRWSLKAH